MVILIFNLITVVEDKMYYLLNNITKTSMIIFLAFLLIGGCDIDFGTSDDNDNGNSGVDIGEIVEGTVVDTIPGRPADQENIEVIVTDDETDRRFSDTTGVNGFFSIMGSFSGSPDIQFLDNEDSGSSLGIVIINVFPGAEVDLGDIRLENGNVIFLDDTEVDFEADLIQNNCFGNSGNLLVEIDLSGTDDDPEILVQINSSTDIEIDGLDSDCDDLLIGQELEINGILLIGDNVDANQIDVD